MTRKIRHNSKRARKTHAVRRVGIARKHAAKPAHVRRHSVRHVASPANARKHPSKSHNNVHNVARKTSHRSVRHKQSSILHKRNAPYNARAHKKTPAVHKTRRKSHATPADIPAERILHAAHHVKSHAAPHTDMHAEKKAHRSHHATSQGAHPKHPESAKHGADHAAIHHDAHAGHDSLKEGIIEGMHDASKSLHAEEKKIQKSQANMRFTADDILRRLFVVEDKVKKKPGMKEKTYLKTVLNQAGYTIDSELLKKRVFRYNMLVISFLTLYLLGHGFVLGLLGQVIIPIIVSWIVFYPTLLLITWGVVFLILDYKKYMRKKELEEVWPEYLQLVVSNINAGMLIDVALWSAVKPKYKVLAKEIEQVAKETLTGKELGDALNEFAEKYDSVMVQRTISLLNEGMESGGRIATLLNKISLDIQDNRIMRKEMSASVMTYAIFISFATVVAAPFLFALSTQLLTIIHTIVGKLGETSTTTMISFSSDNVKVSDFRIFAYIMLGITSFMSACLIGSIRRGSIKDGLKFIPLFVVGTLIIYYFASIILASLFGSLI